MSILSWIEDKKRLELLAAPRRHPPYGGGGKADTSQDSSKGLWTRCDRCGVILYIKHLKENQRVCFGCSYHLQMMSQERIEMLLDKLPAEPLDNAPTTRNPDDDPAHRARLVKKKPETLVSSWRPIDETVSPCDPLSFQDQKPYTNRLRDAQERTGLQDAIQTGTGMIDGIPVALAVMDFSFMGGSMGSVVGEKITRLIEYATGEGLTLVIVSASGGARMQEGVFSLMQMAKISGALQIYQNCANLLYISILTSPTTGGVTASFAMLGDVIFAEPKALIAFAGRRVIEQTLREELPDDFQTSEYMLHHGLVDLIVPRRFLRQALSETIRLYQNAPFKKRGHIPFGVQNPITFLTEERLRRQWNVLVGWSDRQGVSHLEDDLSAIRPRKARARDEQDRSGRAVRGLFGGASGDEPGRAVLETERYREISLSFRAMLHLFVSGKTKKQNQTFYDKGGLEALQIKNSGLRKPLQGYKGNGTANEAAPVSKAIPRVGLLRCNPWQTKGDLPLMPPTGAYKAELCKGIASEICKSRRVLYGSNKAELFKGKGKARGFYKRAGSSTVKLFSRPTLSRTNRGGNGSVPTPERTLSTGGVSLPNRSRWTTGFGSRTSTRGTGFALAQNGWAGTGRTSEGPSSLTVNDDASFTARGADTNLFAQAIELAATESVEWRAFYIDQHLSEGTGFLEDFLQQDLGGTVSDDEASKAGNMLFYKSICRSRKALRE